MIALVAIALLVSAGIAFSRSRWVVTAAAGLFFAAQAALALRVAFGSGAGATEVVFFTYDPLGVLFFCVMTLVSAVVFCHGISYLKEEPLREYKIYHVSLVLLCASIAGVYFSNNLVVTWVFLEATTLCTAGLVYHHRNPKSLEATWKYIFVCSTGIAIAYLGILLISSAAQGGDLSYANLAAAVATGNPLYMKLAFVFILVGYSCKLEIFPLYPIGVDANSVAPTPASALISTALVNAGFVALFRVYNMMGASAVFPWARRVLVIAGVLSLLFGALFLRRTNNYKRLLAYSTVENMGLVVIGLGIGGAGVFAALFHMLGHSLVKSGMFLQITQVWRTYRTHRINRSGEYFALNPLGAVLIIVSSVLLMAFPPSPLFVSEVMLLRAVAGSGAWWLIVTVVLIVCVVIYTICSRIARLCYHPLRTRRPAVPRGGAMLWSAFGLVVLAAVLGVWQPAWLVEWLNSMIV